MSDCNYFDLGKLFYFSKMVEETIVAENEGKTENVVVEPKPLFSIEILRLIRDAQKQHGLRHGDYQRYRGM